MKGQTSEEKKQAQVEALLARKELKRKRIMLLYIQCTEQLLREEGIQNLSIRRIADVTGYSSGTLYSYFEDLEELILYASFKFRKEYLKRVAKEITDDMTSLEQYRKIYQIFNEYSFRDPEIYMNMYFGKHSERIKTVMKEYYLLFPDEFVAPTELIRSLLLQGNLIDCDKLTTGRLARDGFIRAENADQVAEVLVRLQETFIYDLAVNPGKDLKEQSEAFMRLFDYVISVS